MTDAMLVLTTLPDSDAAAEVVKKVLRKTRQQQFERLKQRILELQPYDVPEMIAIPVEQGHKAHLDWIASETG